MNASAKSLTQLQKLSCFTDITQIEAITTGLSQPSYRVCADDKDYFAKYVGQQYLSDEVAISQISADANLSPSIIYCDKHWLISDYIDGQDLGHTRLAIADKIACALKLMTRFHQLAVSCETLDITTIYNGLIKAQANSYSSAQLATFQQLMAIIKSHTDINSELVSCHGDLNFNNILIDKASRSWLIDFECSCKAPAEFDIAMLIAVNELPVEQIAAISTQYQEQNPPAKLNQQSIHYFLLFSYLINGLWYENKRHTEQEYQQKFAALAKRQWQQLQRFIINMELAIDSSIFTR